MELEKIDYQQLNSRQKETFNFQKVASKLADYGFSCILLNDDWQGADFIANHFNGDQFLKVQLKSRLTFDNKYENKNIFICFPDNGDWYLYPHDDVRDAFLEVYRDKMAVSSSWVTNQHYTFNRLSKKNRDLILKYKL